MATDSEIATSLYLTLLQSRYRISSETTGQIFFKLVWDVMFFVHAQIWFRSVNKYGRRRPSWIFLVIASTPQPDEEFHQSFALGFLSTPRHVSAKMIPVYRLIWQPDGHHSNSDFPLLNIVTISLSHLLRDHLSFFLNFSWLFP